MSFDPVSYAMGAKSGGGSGTGFGAPNYDNAEQLPGSIKVTSFTWTADESCWLNVTITTKDSGNAKVEVLIGNTYFGYICADYSIVGAWAQVSQLIPIAKGNTITATAAAGQIRAVTKIKCY